MVHVQLAREWTDDSGTTHAAGETVDVDPGTLARLEVQGWVADPGDGDSDPESWVGPTGGSDSDPDSWVGPTGGSGSDPDSWVGPTGGGRDNG